MMFKTQRERLLTCNQIRLWIFKGSSECSLLSSAILTFLHGLAPVYEYSRGSDTIEFLG